MQENTNDNCDRNFLNAQVFLDWLYQIQSSYILVIIQFFIKYSEYEPDRYENLQSSRICCNKTLIPVGDISEY